MKKILMTTLAAILTMASANAQVKPMLPNDHQAMVRLDQAKRYLLLPVE